MHDGVAIAVFLLSAAPALAGDALPRHGAANFVQTAGERSLRPSVSADLTLASQYMTHGFQVYDDWSLQPTVVLGCPLTGLEVQGWASLPVDRGDDGADEWDALLKYGRTLGGHGRGAVNVHGFVDYWVYPNLELTTDKDGDAIAATDKDGLKLNLGVTLPNLLPAGGSSLAVSYNVFHWLPVEDDLFEDGTAHELSLALGVPFSQFMTGCERAALGAGAAVTYHDGAFDVASGWSHAVAQVSTKHHVGVFCLSPGVNYQWSFEDTVHADDEFWATFSIACGL